VTRRLNSLTSEVRQLRDLLSSQDERSRELDAAISLDANTQTSKHAGATADASTVSHGPLPGLAPLTPFLNTASVTTTPSTSLRSALVAQHPAIDNDCSDKYTLKGVGLSYSQAEKLFRVQVYRCEYVFFCLSS
jgi:hypothetical protein